MSETEPIGTKTVNIDDTDLEHLTDTQLLWNMYLKLKSIQMLLVLLVAVTLAAVLGSAYLTIQAINEANAGGF